MSEVAVIGGGLVGLLFSLRYHQSGIPHRLHLFDAGDPTRLFDDKRPLSLSAYTQKALREIGVWDALCDDAYPLHGVYVSAEQHAGHAALWAEDEGLEALGWVVPAGRLYRLLYEAQPKHVHLHKQCKLVGMQRQDDGWQLTVDAGEGEIIRKAVTWVVAADGVQSAVRTCLQADVHTDGHFHATVFPSQHIKHHQRPIMAHQRFTPKGSVAMLPLSNDRASIVWTHRETPPDPETLWQHTQQTFRHRFTLPNQVPKAICYASSIQRMPVMAQRGVFWLGNAAHALPPVAAQGFNLGVRDVLPLVDLMRQDVASMEALYQQRRERDAQQTYEACCNIMQLFEPWRSPLNLPRTLGFWALDGCHWLKRIWLERGVGWAGGRL